MNGAADSNALEARRLSRTGTVILGGALFCLLAAGLLLWWHRGDAIFSDVVLAALAWCF